MHRTGPGADDEGNKEVVERIVRIREPNALHHNHADM
jgi:hypothetical protein